MRMRGKVRRVARMDEVENAVDQSRSNEGP